ncbi:MAG TPA: MASE1 domain-containing protein, partial [Terriglobales bacterium]
MTQELDSKLPWLRYGLRVIIVFLLYFAAGRIGLSVPFTSENVSPLWPSAGLALGAILLWGYRVWPGILAGAFLVNFSTSIPALASGLIALGNTSSALLAAYLLLRVKRMEPSLVRLRDVLALLAFGAGVSPLAAASVGVTALYLQHLEPWSRFASAWRIWWCGDAMGVLIATPLFLAASRLRWPLRITRPYELVALLAGLVAVCLVIFSSTTGVIVRDDVLAFLLFPFVMWAAIRFRIAGAAVVSAIITVIAVWGTAHGFGPFVSHPPLHDAALLQLFVATASSTGLILAAVMSEREHISEAYDINQKLLHQLEETQRSLTEHQARLELAQRAARMGVWEWDLGNNEVTWSLGAPALYGMTERSLRIPYDKWLEFVHADDREAVIQSVNDALAGKREHDLEFRTLMPNGETRWLAGRGTTFRDAAGNPTRMTGICVDVTELKKVQNE